jgi:hypothetical protein
MQCWIDSQSVCVAFGKLRKTEDGNAYASLPRHGQWLALQHVIVVVSARPLDMCWTAVSA